MRDPKTENYLNRGAFSWVYRELVPFSEIDLATSENNPARLERKIDQDRAVQYGLEMEAGVGFPAIVLLNITDSDPYKWVVATGMHRTKGAELADLTGLDAYCVTEADTYRREVVSRQLNALEGRGMSVTEQIMQILWLHENYGKPLTTLAKEWGVKLHTVQNHAGEKRARERARLFGFDLERAKIPQKTALVLGQIASDVVFNKALEFIIPAGGIAQSEARDMASEVKQARDEASQLAVVQKYKEASDERIRLSRAKHGRIQPAAANRVMGDVRRLSNHFTKPLDQLHIAALEQRDDALIQVRQLIKHLHRFEEEIERIERLSTAPSVGLRRGPNHSGSNPEMRV